MGRAPFALTIGAMVAAGGLLIVQQTRPAWLTALGAPLRALSADTPAVDRATDGPDDVAVPTQPDGTILPFSTPGRTVGDAAGAAGVSPFRTAPPAVPGPTAHPRAPSPGLAGRLAAAPSSINRPLFPLQPRQIVADGCCGGAWWAADSSALNFIDRPPGSASTAIYTAAVWPPGGQPTVLDAGVLLASGAARYMIRPAGDVSIVRDTVDGTEWPLPTGGNPVRLTPDGTRAVWWDSWGGRADVDNLVRVFGADIHGTDVRELVALFGATVPACMPDSPRCLVIGRPVKDLPMFVLTTIDTVSGTMIELARGTFLSDAALSPDGRWVAFYLALNREHPDRNGVFLAPTFVEEVGRVKKLDFEGAYRWRLPSRLVYVPMQTENGFHTVWEMDANSGVVRRLVGPDAQIRIANNDWSISPDGATMAWVDERGRGVWAVDLP